jgi:hypothetical protein
MDLQFVTASGGDAPIIQGKLGDEEEEPVTPAPEDRTSAATICAPHYEAQQCATSNSPGNDQQFTSGLDWDDWGPLEPAAIGVLSARSMLSCIPVFIGVRCMLTARWRHAAASEQAPRAPAIEPGCQDIRTCVSLSAEARFIRADAADSWNCLRNCTIKLDCFRYWRSRPHFIMANCKPRYMQPISFTATHRFLTVWRAVSHVPDAPLQLNGRATVAKCNVRGREWTWTFRDIQTADVLGKAIVGVCHLHPTFLFFTDGAYVRQQASTVTRSQCSRAYG